MKDLIYANKPEEARSFLEKVKNSKVTSLIVIASTMVSKIKGISIAGENPELTLYTPAADVEYLMLGKCLSINAIPKTPDGIPTPAIISRVCIKLTDIPCLIINAGSYIKPKIPYIEMNGRYGEDIRYEDALEISVAKRLYENAKIFIRSIINISDTFIIGESIPGGTTTSLAFLVALGYDAWDKISSASKHNPKSLKASVVKQALDRIKFNTSNSNNALEIASYVGDPFIIVTSSIVEELIDANKKVILAGGTQMASIVAFLKKNNRNIKNVLIATTRWIIEDNSSDIISLINEIHPVPIIASNLSFMESKYEGLKKYEDGYVKEGVGAGGFSCYAFLRGFSFETIEKEVEKEYERIFV